MIRKIFKKFIVMLLILMTFTLTYNIITYASYSEIDVNFVTKGATETTGTASSINSILGAILTIIQVVGAGGAVIMLIVLAIKYMVAAPGDKADIKKSAAIYILGAVILFSTSGILGIIRKFSGNVKPS